MPKNLLAFVESRSDLAFYLRLQQGLSAKGFKLVLLTPKPSLQLFSFLRGTSCIPVRNSNNSTAGIQLHSTLEVLSNAVNEHDGAKYFNGVTDILERQHEYHGISAMIIRNGNTIPSKALSLFAQKKDIATLYIEPLHLPGKLFADPRGVDTKSLLFQKPGLLDRFSIDARLFEQWRKEFLEDRIQDGRYSILAGNEKDPALFLLINRIGSLFLDLPATRIIDPPRVPDGAVQTDPYDIQTGSYNYFPMQASNDSRLLFNSSVSLQDAVEIAYEKSREQHRDLLIHPHPAESKKVIIDFLTAWRGKEGVRIVNGAPHRLIEKSKELITINSLLGIDAMLMGKKVTFLGASFFAQLTDEQLKKVLFGYLVDIDYYSKKSIPVKQVELLLSRMLLQ
ncbi:MAG: hypothetical protein HYV29_15495 [Ignavibacteriales bacterium]|nr:hypothetical protein [Ignavibacteriales bacterium]